MCKRDDKKDPPRRAQRGQVEAEVRHRRDFWVPSTPRTVHSLMRARVSCPIWGHRPP